MISFNFSPDAKVTLRVWPDYCDICAEYQPVTHIEQEAIAGKKWVDKLCCQCAVKYVTDDALVDIARTHTATLEFECGAEDL